LAAYPVMEALGEVYAVPWSRGEGREPEGRGGWGERDGRGKERREEERERRARGGKRGPGGVLEDIRHARTRSAWS
jgi:hypothetical protein